MYIDIFKKKISDYYFMADTSHVITKINMVEQLASTNKSIISPMLTPKAHTVFTNFWGKVSNSGYYERSSDYIDIVTSTKRGIWNVPYIAGSVLINNKRVPDIITELESNPLKSEDWDMYFCRILRKKYIFLYVINMQDYGTFF